MSAKFVKRCGIARAERLLGLVVLVSCVMRVLSQEPVGGHDWEPLVQAANAARPASPGELRNMPEAAALQQRVVRAYEEKEIAGLAAAVRQHPPNENAGQVIAESLAVSVKYSLPRIDDLAALFMASLAWPDDHSEDVPRGRLSSDAARSYLARNVTGLLTGKGLAADPSASLLSSRPEKWLLAHLEAARGKLGPEGNSAVVRALKVVAAAVPVNGGNVSGAGQPPGAADAGLGSPTNVGTAPASKGLAAQERPKKTIAVAFSQISSWVAIPTALAAAGLLWLVLKPRRK